MMTQSQEDYLEMVGFLFEKHGEARVTALATELGISKPSVSTALKILEEKQLVQHERYGSVKLTQKGSVLAAEIRKKHDVLKIFIHNVLGVNEEIAARDACKIEHVISDETFKKLCDKLPGFLSVPDTEKITGTP